MKNKLQEKKHNTLLGPYQLGNLNIMFKMVPGWGGSFDTCPTDSIPIICIGRDEDNWGEVVETVLHELFETAFLMARKRFSPNNNHTQDSSMYYFFFDHPAFADVCGKVSNCLETCLKDVKAAWRPGHRKIRKV